RSEELEDGIGEDMDEDEDEDDIDDDIDQGIIDIPDEDESFEKKSHKNEEVDEYEPDDNPDFFNMKEFNKIGDDAFENQLENNNNNKNEDDELEIDEDEVLNADENNKEFKYTDFFDK